MQTLSVAVAMSPVLFYSKVHNRMQDRTCVNCLTVRLTKLPSAVCSKQAPAISVNLEAYAITINLPETCLYSVGVIYITLVQKFLLEKIIGNAHKKSKVSYET